MRNARPEVMPLSMWRSPRMIRAATTADAEAAAAGAVEDVEVG